MTLSVRILSPDEIVRRLDDLADLRIAVFCDWPYLYDGTRDYERRYLSVYRDSPDSVVVGAFDRDRLVGAATGAPMEDHADDFATPLAESGLALPDIFYCAESVLLPAYRGQGVGHRFFDLRERHARALGRRWSVFCSVIRPDDHPARPAVTRSLEGFWRGRGYGPLPGVVATFRWRDVGDIAETAKPLQVWLRDLEPMP